MDALEILIFANALFSVVTLVFFGRQLLELVKTRKHSFEFKFRRRYAIALVLTVVAITGVYGVTLFQHTFPATPSGTLPVISSTCTTLTLETAGMITGVPENMLFNCGPPTAAITSSSAGTSTPTFTLPTQATSLSLVTHVNNVNICTGGSLLTSGQAHTFTSGESLDYCLASNSYPNSGIPTFTVTWSQ